MQTVRNTKIQNHNQKPGDLTDVLQGKLSFSPPPQRKDTREAKCFVVAAEEHKTEKYLLSDLTEQQEKGEEEEEAWRVESAKVFAFVKK